MRTSVTASVLVLVALAIGCNKPRLPAGSEAIDLAPAGMSITMTGPTGGVAKKGVVPGEASVRWGDLGIGGEITIRAVRTHKIGCQDGDSGCKLVEQKLTGAVYETKIRQKPVWEAVHHFLADKTEAECSALAFNVDDAKRLLGVCESIKVKGPLVSTTEVTSATLTVAPQPLLFETKTFDVKPVTGKPFKVSARTPKGWGASDQLGTALVKDPSPMSASALSITLGAAPPVKTLADAEREARKLDLGGLDTLGETRELAPGRFLVATAPRGSLKLTTIRVFSRGKKGTAIATCSGPAARRADLEEVCTSVTAE